MKNFFPIPRGLLHLATIAVASLSFTSVQAAAPALQGQLKLRPLTPTEIKSYSLTGAQGASGLSTVGKGQPAYLEVLVNNAVPDADITNITWTLTAKPAGSVATLLTSPLGINVPTYRMADRFNQSGAAVYKVAGGNGRRMLRPDATGKYTVTVTVQTASSGSTNMTQDVTAGTYMGVNTCALCHSGGVAAPDKYQTWQQTPHAHAFEAAITGANTDHFSANCISCHVVGFDSNTNAVNGGFDDLAASLNWTFPATLSQTNWDAMAPALKNVSNVQCENCHGAGSEHALGELLAQSMPELKPAAKAAIAVTFEAGNCSQCHDSLTHHYRSAEWNNSKHAVTTRTPTGSASRAACARCHTPAGFAEYTDTLGTTNAWTGTNTTLTTYGAISCATCHDPHDASNPHQLRVAPSVTLGDGETVATINNAGAGALCMNCHQSRSGSYTNSLVGFPLGRPTYAGGSSSFGPHDNPAADMIEGVNGYTYGKFIPSAAHASAVTDTCVGCHMQSVESGDPAFTHAGGHTFSMTYDVVNAGVTNKVDKVDVCVKCHGAITSFDMVRQDYNGDGVIEGVQTEVEHLLNELNALLPNSTYRADGNYVASGVTGSVSVKTNWPAKYLQAAWNWQLVEADLSLGVHNAPYAVGLLKASIADLTDDADHDGLSDTWERAQFGSINLFDGNGDPDGDGVSNALELAAGTNPMVVDTDGDGVSDLAELQAGSDPANPADKPGFVVKIYTAAEVEFASEVGKNYQVQRVSDLTGAWLNVGSVTNGTGNNISMTTSTRSGGTQGYFRVVQVP